LHHKIDPASYRAASTLLLCCPETPLLFMGQEWAASTPFQFFTDHHQELGRLVTEGRRSEFKRFAVFAQPASRAKIPDSQDHATFERCRLDWHEVERGPHAAMLRLYRALLHLRLAEPAFLSSEKADVIAAGDEGILLRRRALATQPGPAGDILVIVCLRDSGSLDFTNQSVAQAGDGLRWEILLTTEDHQFAEDSHRIDVNLAASGPVVHFCRPGAVVLRLGKRSVERLEDAA
jgi:maltooligosyltrehalose trehalohydrolase